MATSQSNSYSTYAANVKVNRDQYDQIMRGYENTRGQYDSQTAGINAGYDKMLGGLDQWGASQNLGNQQQFSQQTAGLQQQAGSRGLYNSSILGNMQQGAGQQLALANMALGGQLLDRRLGIQGQQLGYQQQAQQGAAGLSGNELGFMGQMGGQTVYQTTMPDEVQYPGSYGNKGTGISGSNTSTFSTGGGLSSGGLMSSGQSGFLIKPMGYDQYNGGRGGGVYQLPSGAQGYGSGYGGQQDAASDYGYA